MEYKDIRANLEEMINDNYKNFIKALVSIEKGVNDEKALEEVYVLSMNNDTTGLLKKKFLTTPGKARGCGNNFFKPVSRN